MRGGKVDDLATMGLSVALGAPFQEEGAEPLLTIAHVPSLLGEQLDAALPVLRINHPDVAALLLQR